MKRYFHFLLYCVFSLSVLFQVSAETMEEFEALRKYVLELEEENSELRLQLNQSQTTIEAQAETLSKKESAISAFRESQRKSREAQRLSSNSSIGRNRGPAGDIKLGSLTLGGAIRANYISGDYDNIAADGSLDGPSRSNGSAYLDTLIFNGEYDFGNLSAFAEYRFYDEIGSFGGIHFLHSFYLAKEFNDGSEFKLGVVDVPFGVDRFGAAYGYLNNLDYIVGLADDRDLGLTYSFALSSWDVDLGYFWGSEPSGEGRSKDSARGSFDVISPMGSVNNPSWPYTSFLGESNNYLEGNFSPWEEGRQINARIKKQFYLGGFDNIVGASYQYGRLDSTDELDRFDQGDVKAGSVFLKSTYGSWQLKASLTDYHYDIDKLKDGNSFTRYNPDQIVFGIFDYPMFVASEGLIPAIGLSYSIFPRNLGAIDYIIPYIDYSKLIKDGNTNGPTGYYYLHPNETDFKDSEQFSLGTMFGVGNMLIYVDYSLGKGSPLIGNNNDQYFTGASINQPFFPSATFDEGWQRRLTINFGYYY